MTTRAAKTAAKKTAATKDTAPAPATKKAPAGKKPAPKRGSTTTATRQRATRTRKPAEAAPVLTLVKPGATAPTTEPDTGTVTTPLPKLAVRRKVFVGPMGPSEQAAIRAALAAARLALPVPVRTWNGSQAQLADGTLLIHNPGPDRAFTAHIACPHGSIHGYPITNENDLRAARAITKACGRRHSTKTAGEDGTELDWDKAIQHGVRHTSRLGEGIQQIRKTVAETQPIPIITTVTPGRVADTKPLPAEDIAAITNPTAKEHPQP